MRFCHNQDVRVLAIDLGRKRIGLALSDRSATLASPWQTLERPSSDQHTVSALEAIVTALADEDDGLGGVVVGLPKRLDGTPTDQTADVLRIAQALGARIGMPVVLQDERLSSIEAESRLALNERDWRRRKRRLDAAAAAVILQDFLDQRAAQAPAAAHED
jgi:putative Holliday junction resolvase